MIRSKLLAIRDYIKSANEYFDAGYTDVTVNSRGIVANDEIVFPMDGSYFYIRQASRSNFTNNGSRITDCTSPISLSMDLFIVAVVDDGDSTVLAENLIVTMQNYSDGITFSGLIMSNDDVINQELSLLSVENRDAAIARSGNKAIVCLIVTASILIKPTKLNCITKPCSCS